MVELIKLNTYKAVEESANHVFQLQVTGTYTDD